MIDKLKQHWLISIIIVCAVVSGATWRVALELLVYPRDFQISQLQEQVKQSLEVAKSSTSKPTYERNEETPTSLLVLPKTGVFEKSSVTTNDGICTIRIDRASDYGIDLEVTVASNEPIKFGNQRLGERVAVNFENYTYYVDLHRVRGNIVDLAVYKYAR